MCFFYKHFTELPKPSTTTIAYMEDYDEKTHIKGKMRSCKMITQENGEGQFWMSRPVLSLGKILSLSRCPFVPGQGQFPCPGVPKSCTVPSRWKR